MIDPRRAAEELARRAQNQTRAEGTIQGIRAELFDKQIAFIDDPSRNKAALCTRRAGKTQMWSRYCTITALQNPKSLIRIWGITKLRAKELLWQEFIDVCRRHKIKLKTHDTTATITFENGSEIRLLGADKEKEAQKRRGDKTIMEVVLESQLFGPFLRALVEDVAEPCLLDLEGTMCMEGTPGPVPTGYWYYITGDADAPESGTWTSQGMLISSGKDQERERVGAGWSCHRWSLLDNPHLPHAARALEELRKKRSWSVDSPTYMREYLGRWVKDDGILFYKFNEGRNTYRLDQIIPWGPGWTHVLGWDLGARDDMALVAWGWHPAHRELYEAGSWKEPGASAEKVVEQMKAWEQLGMNFIAKVADTQGGGLMTVNHVQNKLHVVFMPAKKSDKAEHVRLMNDDFVAGRIKCQEGSELAMEYAGLPKDPDWDPFSGKPPAEDPRFPNHCTDAGLYSWREAQNHNDFREATEEKSIDDKLEEADEQRLTRGANDGREFWDEEFFSEEG